MSTAQKPEHSTDNKTRESTMQIPMNTFKMMRTNDI